MDKTQLKHHDYIGDGVYTGWDGFQVWIWTSNGVEDGPMIALENPVIEALVRYAKRVQS